MVEEAATQRTTERVADAIRDGIYNGHFAPGQHLVEIDLTKRLGISRSSLREALHQLRSEGIVTMSRYRGTHICRLSRKAIADLLDVLEALVSLAAEQASSFDSDASVALDAAIAVEEMHQRAARPPELLMARQNFYNMLFELAENSELPRVTPLRRADLFRAQIRPYQSSSDTSLHISGYRQIAQAVADRKGDAARQAVRQHFQATRAAVARLPEVAFHQD